MLQRAAKDRILSLPIIVGYVINIVKNKELLTTFILLCAGDFLFMKLSWISITFVSVSSETISMHL